MSERFSMEWAKLLMEARQAGLQQGAAAERAAILAWLDSLLAVATHDRRDTIRLIRGGIERGEHEHDRAAAPDADGKVQP